MPYKSEKIKLPENLDRRRKLNDAQKAEIKERAKHGESQRMLAKEYGVSRRLIGMIVSPEQKAAVERDKRTLARLQAQQKRMGGHSSRASKV